MLSHITAYDLIHWLGSLVLISSILSMLLPPVEWFSDWPKFQKFYDLFVKIVHKYAALNARSLAMSKIYGVDISKQAAVAEAAQSATTPSAEVKNG